MNVYDKINELADALKNSNEMKEYVEIKKSVYAIPDNKKLVEDFRQKQIEVQKMGIEGKSEEETKKKMEILQQMYQILLQNEEIKKMFDAEVRIDILIGDMYKILGEAIKGAVED